MVKKLIKNRKYVMFALTLCMVMAFAGAAGAEEPTPPPELRLNFNVAEMFTWTQLMLDALLPVVYITLGIALAFLVIRSLKQAFN